MKNKNPKSFDEAMKSLEEITNLIQNNELPLEKAIQYYQDGKNLVEFCKKKLITAEQKLKILENDDKLHESKIDQITANTMLDKTK